MKIRPYLAILRPQQWVKNGFCFAGVLFSHRTLADCFHAAIVFMAFCSIASAIYVTNDVIDCEADKANPLKCKRPYASGQVGEMGAIALIAALVPIPLLLSPFMPPHGLEFAYGYFFIGLAYCWIFKHVVLLDVFTISMGFMLRILAGTIGIGIPPSHWLLITGLMGTLFLGFTKRRAQVCLGDADRPYFSDDLPLLDKWIAITAGATIIAYALYTLAPETIRYHGTDALAFTVPFVIYGILRYSMLDGEDISKNLMRDPHLALCGLGWLGLTGWICWQ